MGLLFIIKISQQSHKIESVQPCILYGFRIPACFLFKRTTGYFSHVPGLATGPTANIPDDIFEAFKVVSDAPETEKSDAVIFVADIVVPDTIPVNVPPVKGKTKI